MPRGGLRNPRGGRPKGRKDGRARSPTTDRVLRSRLDDMAQMAKVEALELPVERLLRRLNDTSLDERYRDTLAIAVAPYCSPRLNALAVVKRPSQWSDDEISRVLGLVEEDLLRLGVDRDKHKYPYEIEVPDAPEH